MSGEPLVLVRTLSARCFTAISALYGHSCRKWRVPARFRCLRCRFARRRGRRCRRSRVESANSLRCRRQAAPLFNSFAGPLRRTISAYFSRYLEARWSLWITIRRLVGSLALVGNARSEERYTSDISLDVPWRTDPHRPTD